MQRRHAFPTLLALGSAALWGVVEFMALCRSRWSQRPRALR